MHADDWPSRSSLATLYRTLGTNGGPGLPRVEARRLLCGDGRAHALSPEVAARSARVVEAVLAAADAPLESPGALRRVAR